MQNYKLNCWLGNDYPPNSIVPAHVVEVGHDHRRLLELGLIEPSGLPTNVTLVAPKAAVETGPDDVVQERNRLASDNKALREENTKLRGMASEFEKARDGLREKCGEYTETISHLERACEDHQSARDVLEKRIAELTADLEAATSPAETGTKSASSPPDIASK